MLAVRRKHEKNVKQGTKADGQKSGSLVKGAAAWLSSGTRTLDRVSVHRVVSVSTSLCVSHRQTTGALYFSAISHGGIPLVQK